MPATKKEPQRKKNLRHRGKGDSVKEIADYWGDATIDEIYKRVKEWETKQSRKT